ncbi:MAG: hypothetical protein WC472_03560 [Candidatus Paceibacterota bacterium]
MSEEIIAKLGLAIKDKREVLYGIELFLEEQKSEISSLISEIQSICLHEWKEIYLYRRHCEHNSSVKIGWFCPICEAFKKNWNIQEICNHCEEYMGLCVEITIRGDVYFRAKLVCLECGYEICLTKKV